MQCPSGLMVEFSFANMPRKNLIILKFIKLFSTAVPSQDLPLVLLISPALPVLQKTDRFKQLCVFFFFCCYWSTKNQRLLSMTHSFLCVNPPSEQWTNEAIQMSAPHVILMEPCNSCHTPHVSLKHNIIKYCQHTNGCVTHEWINGMCYCFPSQDINNLPHAGSLKPFRNAENCYL